MKNDLIEICPPGNAQHRIHVAMVTETYPPDINGVAMTIGRLVDELLRLGHAIQLIRPRPAQPDLPLPADGLDSVLVRGLPLPGYTQLKFGLPATRRLLDLWTRERPDIVHIVTEGPLGWSALRACKQLGLPCCTDFHTNFHSYSRHYGIGLLARPVAAYLRRFHNRAGSTMVPTGEMREELAAEGYRNLRVVARGVESTLFHPGRRSRELRAAWGVGEAQAAVIHVGRLAPEKNLALLFTAFEAMRARHAGARLIVVGDGPSRRHFETRYPQHVFAGMRRGEDLAAHYASGDIFLMPSLTETYGNVTMEAMASGLAVLAYDYAAAREHIACGVNGVTARPGDARAFIAQACALIDDPARRRHFATQARLTAERLSWAQVAGDLLETYREVIGRQARVATATAAACVGASHA